MDHITGFEQWLMEDGKSPKTIESYYNDVKQFQRYLEKKGSSDQSMLSRFAFVRYKQHLLDEAFAVATINKKVNSLKVYNDFLQVKGVVTDSFIQLRKDRVPVATGSERVVQAMTDEEVERVLFFVQDSAKVSVRNRLIVYLLLYTAVRVSELVNIMLTDVDSLACTLTVRGKGGKVREIGLRNDVLELMQTYQTSERQASRFRDSDYLLVSQRAEKLHRDAVRDWLAKISDELGIKLTPHLFRRTCATLLLRRGAPIVTVSKILGHHSVAMTANMYIQTSRKDKQDALDLL